MINSKNFVDIKIKVPIAYVWSFQLYGCACWANNEVMKKKLEAIAMCLYRRIMKISWMKKETNEKRSCSRLADSGRSLMTTTRKRLMKFSRRDKVKED